MRVAAEGLRLEIVGYRHDGKLVGLQRREDHRVPANFLKVSLSPFHISTSNLPQALQVLI